MRRALFALAVLLPAVAAASGRMIRDGEVARAGFVADRDPSLLLFLPLNTNGPLIGDDPGTVAHVYWNGSALVDTKGNAWTMNGTVPQVGANLSPFTPGRGSAGTFSAADYYSLGTGLDVLDFTGDFSVCAIFTPTSSTNDAFVVSATDLTDGWLLDARVNNAGVGSQIQFRSGGVPTSVALPLAQQGIIRAPNILCGGRAGATGFVKQNLGATVTGAAGTITPAVTASSRIGGFTTSFLPGTLHEVWASTTTPSDALFTAIQRRVFAQLYLAVTRTGSATYQQNSRIWNVAPNVVRITSDGALVEPTRTNYAQFSDQLDVPGGWSQVNMTLTASDAQDYGWGTNTMERYTASVVSPCGVSRTGNVVTSTTGPFTASAWVAAVSGTAIERVAFACTGGTATATACARSDGGVCNFSSFSATATGFATVGTTPIRLSVTGTCSPALTNPAVGIGTDTRYDSCVIGSTGYFGGVQLEIGSFASSYIPTTTTALARNADTITFPSTLKDPTHFCLRSTIKPELNAPWPGTGLQANVTLANGFISPNILTTAVFWQTWDSAANVRACSNLTALTINTAYTFRQSLLYPGVMAMSLNGIDLPCTFTGAGTAILTAQPANIQISPSAFQYKDVQLYRTGTCR